MGPESDDEERLISDPYGLTRSYLHSSYHSRTEEYESRYEEEQGYSFGERLDSLHLASGDFEWFNHECADSLELMAEKACESQRKAIQRRLWAIRLISIAKFAILWGGWFPPWFILSSQRSRDLSIMEMDTTECTRLFEMNGVPNYDLKDCAYYSSTRSAFVTLSIFWCVTFSISTIITFVSSWRPHARIFTEVAARLETALGLYGTLVAILAIMNVALMSEPFNWKIAVDPKRLKVTPPYYYMTPHNKLMEQSTQAMCALAAITLLTLALTGVWIILKYQLRRYGLDLEEFCPKTCGGAVKHNKAKNRRKIMAWIADRTGIPMPLEQEDLSDSLGSSVMIRGEQSATKQKSRISPRRQQQQLLLSRSSHSDGQELGTQQESYRNGEVEMDKYLDHFEDEHDAVDPNSHSPSSRFVRPSGTSSVLELMTNLSSTMSALNQKIDAIESRVGDGAALLVMPPGENQWDAVKKDRN